MNEANSSCFIALCHYALVDPATHLNTAVYLCGFKIQIQLLHLLFRHFARIIRRRICNQLVIFLGCSPQLCRSSDAVAVSRPETSESAHRRPMPVPQSPRLPRLASGANALRRRCISTACQLTSRPVTPRERQRELELILELATGPKKALQRARPWSPLLRQR